ncbi:OmpA family protein [Alistipes sp. ZOR0009]|uniref:OmpA family protein n=1 Tax=Alistipes sp. ZOR0009 TaxID=1339253 RepID=UPI00068B6C86|nr:OmpA family protein [Alistipes sp. ZOR0009]
MSYLKKVFLFGCMFLIANQLDAQTYTSKNKKAIKLYETALTFFEHHNYIDFFNTIDEVLTADNQFIEPYLLAMQACMEKGDADNALKFGEKAYKINPLFYPFLSAKLGEIKLKKGEYADAIKYFQFFVEKNPSQQSKVSDLIERAKFAVNLQEHPVTFNPINLGDSINTQYDDYWPSVTGDGKTFVKTSNTPIKNNLTGYQEDFYVSYQLEDKGWSSAIKMPGNINTAANEGALSLTADGKGMYFTICTTTCHLFYSKNTNNGWSKPEKLPAPVNTNASDKQPSISPDGKYLYFTSNRAGGYGGYDLYMAIRDDETGEWSSVKNLGSTINTPKNDVAPFIHFDGSSLYFSSDGHWGMGGLDIFVSRKLKENEWSKPENIGFPINTKGEEQGIVISPDTKNTYFATNRSDNNGLDIYTFEMPEQHKPMRTSYIKGVVLDSKTKKPLDAKIILGNLSTGNDDFITLSKKEDGTFFTSLPAFSSYAMQIVKAGYLFYSESFKLDSIRTIQNPYVITAELTPIAIGASSILQNVYFNFNEYKLLPESFVELHRLVILMQENPTMWIEISGHTDNIGKKDYNKKLSEYRALAVKKYLVDNGIDSNRIKPVGYGSEKPVADNISENTRKKNRRTEMRVLYK